MPSIFIYLIKLSCSLGLSWLFYRLVLHNLTFYTLNRWYLLGYTLLSFVIPLVDIGPIRGEDPAQQPLIVQYIPVVGTLVDPSLLKSRAFFADPWNDLLLLLGLGSCVLLIRFLIRCYSLRRMQGRAELLDGGPVKIFRVADPIAPFSFGNAIYVNPEQHDEKEWEEIILHEYVHIRQRHTLDILLAEFLVITSWYNPFAWLIRYSIRQNLEFIADRAVVENGFDKKGYQYHLLKVVGQNRYRLANNFNFSSLKKRIIMMNKIRSARLHLLRFLFILPLLTVLLVAFRNRAIHTFTAQPTQLTPAIVAQPQPKIQVAPQTLPTRQPQHHAMAAVTDTVPRKRDTVKISRLALDFHRVLWIVDGVVKPRGWYGFDSLKGPDIAGINIYEGDDATKVFGEQGANGVVYIITKKPGNVPLIIRDRLKSEDVLYIVDGVVANDNDIRYLDPSTIESMNIPKPGVIMITTKKAHPRITPDAKDANGNPIPLPGDTIKMLGPKLDPQS